MDIIQHFLTCPEWKDTYVNVFDKAHSAQLLKGMRELHLAWHTSTTAENDLLGKVETVTDLAGTNEELLILLSAIRHSLHSRFDRQLPGSV
jgi:hypothetical protein